MANYQNLKAAISAAIKTNGNQEITGQVLQDVLNSIVSVIGANYTFAGVATPATNPGTPDQNVVYLASEGGTYTNFNGTVLPAGISLLMWNGTWTSKTVMYGDGGVFDISVYKSTGGTLATFADLAAALDGGNNIPASARKGGMSVKFVQSSDNKYIQYRLMSDTFNTTVANWQGVDDVPTAGSNNLVKSNGVRVAIDEVSFVDSFIPEYQRAENYMLSTSGYAVSAGASDYRLVKYDITGAYALKMNLSKDGDVVAQFSSSVSTLPTNKIGEQIRAAVDGYVYVPSGAKYLIVSQLKTNSTNSVELATPSTLDEISKEIGDEFIETKTETSSGSTYSQINVSPSFELKAGSKVDIKLASAVSYGILIYGVKKDGTNVLLGRILSETDTFSYVLPNDFIKILTSLTGSTSYTATFTFTSRLGIYKKINDSISELQTEIGDDSKSETMTGTSSGSTYSQLDRTPSFGLQIGTSVDISIPSAYGNNIIVYGKNSDNTYDTLGRINTGSTNFKCVLEKEYVLIHLSTTSSTAYTATFVFTEPATGLYKKIEESSDDLREDIGHKSYTSLDESITLDDETILSVYPNTPLVEGLELKINVTNIVGGSAVTVYGYRNNAYEMLMQFMSAGEKSVYLEHDYEHLRLGAGDGTDPSKTLDAVIKLYTHHNATGVYVDVDGKLNADVFNKSISELQFLKNITQAVIFLGDSTTQGLISDYGNTADKSGGGYIVYNVLTCSTPLFFHKLTGIKTYNAGHSGWTAKTWWHNWKDSFPIEDVNLFFMEFCYNGGLTDTLDTDVEPYSDYNDYADTNTGCFCKIIEYIYSFNPNAYIVPVISSNRNAAEVNNSGVVVAKIAQKYGLNYIDLRRTDVVDLMSEVYHGKLKSSSATKDFTHFNALGYETKAMAELYYLLNIINNDKENFKTKMQIPLTKSENGQNVLGYVYETDEVILSEMTYDD